MVCKGPGQYIRPAPAFGPGSGSISGLVDYSNIFIKVSGRRQDVKGLISIRTSIQISTHTS
jgi:hypothetical protein